MPAVSKAQQHLMGAAYGGASFPAAQKLRSSMTMKQLSDYASTPTKGLPTRVKKAKPTTPAIAKGKAAKVSQPSRRMRTQEYQSSYGRIQPTLNTASSFGSRRSNF